MNQQQLNEKKERALVALPSEGTPDITKLKAMALFRVKAAQDVLELIEEVERLWAEIQQLKDECDQKEAERLDACDQRNLAYIEVEQLKQDINRMVY